jgi:hypothetical protein
VRRSLGVAAVAVIVAAAASCSSGSGGDDSAAHALPPNDKTAIERVFAPQLERLGVRLTRGALIDLRTGKRSATGTHLAVYVEPTGDYTPDQYARGTASTLRVFIPKAFERWGGLKSFDICQEPLPATDSRPEPPPVTKVTLTRGASNKVKWRNADLSRLLTDTKRLGTQELSVYAKPDVRNTSVYQDAVVKSNTSGATSAPPTTVSYVR